jgi:hypothetical protein
MIDAFYDFMCSYGLQFGTWPNLSQKPQKPISSLF